ncbi:DUF6458 family protein [Spirillospora sp. NPDC029432]|uniref:DUF6458 family protein n=1 Tax=Spirillospora sp. NPDC029432 TaxID=3154599 RepID=UPI0034522E7C
MTIGGSLALIIIGAILAYAVDLDLSGVDIRVVGIILMIGGLAGLVIGIVRIATARRRVPPPPPAVREERYYEDPPPRRTY